MYEFLFTIGLTLSIYCRLCTGAYLIAKWNLLFLLGYLFLSNYTNLLYLTQYKTFAFNVYKEIEIILSCTDFLEENVYIKMCKIKSNLHVNILFRALAVFLSFNN